METVDVVVVGAGFSGLAAARNIVAGGASVVVLEGAERVGGRTDTKRDGSRWIELGGQWAGPGQDRLLALAANYGVATFETPNVGLDLLVSGGQVMPASEAPGAAETAALIAQLDAMAATVPPAEPWRAADAAHWDQLSIAAWLSDQDANPSAVARLRHHLQGLMTASAEDMSVLSVLHGAITSGSLSAAMGVEGGAQELRFDGGLHQLADRLAQDLGDAVRLGHAVTSIEQPSSGAGSALIRTSGRSFEAQRVVVAVPPSALGQIQFTPSLAGPHAALQQSMPLGSVIKLHAVFDRPFWREAGWSGLVVDDDGPLSFMVDNSAPDTDEGALTTFLSARNAVQWGNALLGAHASTRRRQLLADHVRHVFGSASPEMIDYVDRDWVAQPGIGGGYSGVMRPGGWLRCGPAIRQPVGPVHWASSERATTWTGYVEGALESGERAAREVLAAG